MPKALDKKIALRRQVGPLPVLAKVAYLEVPLPSYSGRKKYFGRGCDLPRGARWAGGMAEADIRVIAGYCPSLF